MMVRLDFTGHAPVPRTVRVAPRREPGVSIVAEAGPRLPFSDGSIDELFMGRAVAWRADISETLDELWRVSKPGALVHLTLPHASSVLAVSRDPRPRPLLTLNTFNYYDPRTKPPDAPPTAFSVEKAELRVAGERGADTGLALARGRLAGIIERFANKSRGSQYRFERWFSNVIGFEEFDIVLSVVKPPAPSDDARPRSPAASVAGPTDLRVTSDVEPAAASVEAETGEAATSIETIEAGVARVADDGGDERG